MTALQAEVNKNFLDTDPQETQEWIEALDNVIDNHGQVVCKSSVTSLEDGAVGGPGEPPSTHVGDRPVRRCGSQPQGWLQAAVRQFGPASKGHAL